MSDDALISQPPPARPPARHAIVVRGPLALLAARLDNLPVGSEYVLLLDKTHARRLRWRVIGAAAGWEKAQREEAE